MGGISDEFARNGKDLLHSLVWQLHVDNKRSDCRGTCFGLILWILFKAVSLRTLILYPGGMLKAWVGSWLFVLADGFSVF